MALANMKRKSYAIKWNSLRLPLCGLNWFKRGVVNNAGFCSCQFSATRGRINQFGQRHAQIVAHTNYVLTFSVCQRRREWRPGMLFSVDNVVHTPQSFFGNMVWQCEVIRSIKYKTLIDSMWKLLNYKKIQKPIKLWIVCDLTEEEFILHFYTS